MLGKDEDSRRYLWNIREKLFIKQTHVSWSPFLLKNERWETSLVGGICIKPMKMRKLIQSVNV